MKPLEVKTSLSLLRFKPLEVKTGLSLLRLKQVLSLLRLKQPLEVKTGLSLLRLKHIGFDVESNNKDPKIKVCDYVTI